MSYNHDNVSPRFARADRANHSTELPTMEEVISRVKGLFVKEESVLHLGLLNLFNEAVPLVLEDFARTLVMHNERANNNMYINLYKNERMEYTYTFDEGVNNFLRGVEQDKRSAGFNNMGLRCVAVSTVMQHIFQQSKLRELVSYFAIPGTVTIGEHTNEYGPHGGPEHKVTLSFTFDIYNIDSLKEYIVKYEIEKAAKAKDEALDKLTNELMPMVKAMHDKFM